MARDVSKKQRQEEVYANLHLGMDHILSKMLKQSPPAHAEPLPSVLQLKTGTQPLATTWAQLTASFEKRKAMLQRRREKAERRKHRGHSASPRSATGDVAHRDKFKAGNSTTKQEKSPRDELQKQRKKPGPKPKNKNKQQLTPLSSPRERGFSAPKSSKNNPKNGRSASGDSAESAYSSAAPPDPHSEMILRRLHGQPGLEKLEFGSKKYRAIVKWLETDKGKDDPISMALVMEAQRLRQPKSHSKTPTSPRKLSLKPSSKRRRMSAVPERKSKAKSRTVDEDVIVYESGEEEEEPEYDGGYSDSDDDEEAEFVLTPLSSAPPPPEKPKTGKKRGRPTNASRLKKQKEEEELRKKQEEISAKEQLATVITKLRASKVEPGADDSKYLSYEQEPRQEVQANAKETPGSSAQSVIVLEESEDESEEERKHEHHEERKKEEPVDAAGSSTDDDEELFDLEEEDVYVVETILRVKEGRSLLTAGGKRRTKEADLYLVKWDGYDELTWEPEENIPRRLINLFRERERAKRACQYQIKESRERKVVTNVTTGVKEVIYSIQWVNQPHLVWETRSTLPDRTVLWLDKVLGGPSPTSKKRVKAKATKQFFYQ